jgi:hypothetical protein
MTMARDCAGSTWEVGEASCVLDWMYISQKGKNVPDPETNCRGQGFWRYGDAYRSRCDKRRSLSILSFYKGTVQS